MTNFYITKNGTYYCGDRISDDDILVGVRPTVNHFFDFDSLSWKLDLSKFKEQKNEKIKQDYEKTLTEGVQCKIGFRVNCEPKDIANWTASLQMIREASELGIPMETIQVRDFDNVTHELTISEFKQMCIEIGMYYQSLFNKKWDLQNQISSVDSNEVDAIEQLDKIVW